MGQSVERPIDDVHCRRFGDHDSTDCAQCSRVLVLAGVTAGFLAADLLTSTGAFVDVVDVVTHDCYDRGVTVGSRPHATHCTVSSTDASQVYRTLERSTDYYARGRRTKDDVLASQLARPGHFGRDHAAVDPPFDAPDHLEILSNRTFDFTFVIWTRRVGSRVGWIVDYDPA